MTLAAVPVDVDSPSAGFKMFVFRAGALFRVRIWRFHCADFAWAHTEGAQGMEGVHVAVVANHILDARCQVSTRWVGAQRCFDLGHHPLRQSAQHSDGAQSGYLADATSP